MAKRLDTLEKKLGYAFRDRGLLRQALTRRSMAKSDPDMGHNQRMEFLGDAVLGLGVADMLYELYPEEEEGDLSRRLVALVNGDQLAAIAAAWKLGEYLVMAPGEEEQGGRGNPSNLEDACEAVLGAVYLDGGLKPVEAIIGRFWRDMAKATKAPPKDPKTSLQEWAQAHGRPLPEYHVISAEGPAHAPHFVIEVAVKGLKSARGEAGTKKLAERLAAEAMLRKVK